MTTTPGPLPGWSPPPGDEFRLQALRRYRILDSLPEQAFEDVVQLATTICGTPQAVVTFVDESRQWFKAARGIEGEETERGIAFCDIAIRRPDEVTIVNDASQHPVFMHYPQVTGPDHLRFYAGAPMVTPDGFALGTVCVVDVVPREISLDQVESLRALARMAVALLELRRRELEAQRLLAERELATRELQDYQRSLEARNSELAEEARRDALTGLLNRGGLEQATLGGFWAGGGQFTVALLDIDHFKRINDGHGHAIGDDVLRLVGEQIRQAVRGGDVAARYGGEEFLVLMPATPPDGALSVVERIRQSVAGHPDLPVPVTLSAGIAAGQAGRDDTESVFERADQALYQAKHRGRNRIEVADN
ncbi:diguanylate cyclase [Arenimonas sp.]|uniref:sensor domain-containing diguanylate cyclase n=1 Tax=Arenimonas sp. TaxID=1872635 RepID=UPI0035B257B7